MLVLQARKAAELVGGSVTAGSSSTIFRGVSTDTRKLAQGNLFVAIRGNRHDGHDFIAQAFARGAAAVLAEESWCLREHGWPGAVISCRDSLFALGQLARAYLAELNPRTAAITGSNGKTTTKELARHILTKTASVAASPASYNNAVGVPLTIFQLEPQHQILITEMGTSAPGEIRRLTQIAPAHVAAITSISQTHLEGLGSVANVARAKGEILEGLSADEAAILNYDDPWCLKLAEGCQARICSFRVGAEADIFATDVRQTRQGTRFLVNGKYPCALPMLGRHNVHNLLAAAGICQALGVELRDIPELLEGFQPPPMRLEVHRLPYDITIINDAYNANPKSMEAALEVLASSETVGRRIFVCGGMLELAEQSQRLHRALGAKACEAGVDALFILKEPGQQVKRGALQAGFPPHAVFEASSIEKLSEMLADEAGPGDVILFKASRGIRLERAVASLEERLQSAQTRPRQEVRPPERPGVLMTG